MAYRVKIMPRATRDLASIYDWIDAGSSTAARRWYLGLTDAIRTLSRNPRWSPVAPEHRELRNLLYQQYRIIYRILEKEREVEVLHIRHGARAGLSEKDLTDL